MKKKLISFDAFKQIENNSVSNAERELVEASEMLAKVLGKERLDLHCINESNVTFVNQDGNLVQADYSFDGDKILLENITELVLDEGSVQQSSKKILESMVDNILEDKIEEASAEFSTYFSIPMLRASFREGSINEGYKPKKGKIPPQFLKNIEKMKAKHAKKKGEKEEKGEKEMENEGTKVKGRKAHSKVAECMKKPTVESLSLLANNVLEYVDFMENGNIFQDIRTQKDKSGDVVTVEIPSAKLRNEGKVMKWHKKKGHDKVAEGRGCAMESTNSANWIRAVNDLKRFNALSDHASLQNAFENVAAAWPDLLFLTSGELASKINTTLENSGASNYDSDTCSFLAEGILRTAHRAFAEHVGKVFELAGLPVSEDYNEFAAVSDKVLPMLDAENENTMQVFSDLYRGLYEVYRTADKIGDAYTKAEVGSMIYNVADILNKKQPVDLEVASDAASYLKSLSEAVSLEGAEWKVPAPHESLNGDNPAIHGYASVDGSPAAHPGKFKGTPVSDGKSVKVDVEDEYTAMKGKDLYPDMSNPYAPKPGDFKMHGEKAIEDDKDFGGYQNSDTLPNMKNPYLPDNGMTMQDTLQHLMGSK
jgi:hypothetical protein